MVRWKLKGCPRCSGDLNLIHDDLGYYEDCLQCGYHHYYKDEKVSILPPQPFENENSFEDESPFEEESLEEPLNLLSRDW